MCVGGGCRLNDALWAMAVMWLLCMPLGSLALIAYSMFASLKRGDLQFDRNPGSSFSAFFKKVAAVRAPKGAEDLVTPRVTHGTIKFLLATTGSLLSFLGLRSTITFSSYGCEMTCKDPTTGVFDLLKFNAEHCTWGEDKENCPQSGPEMFIFWIVGVLLIVLASTVLGSKYGRKFVIAITNSISKSVGIEYKMHQDTLVVKAWHTPTPGVRGEPGEMSSTGKLLTSLANLRAQFLALTDPEMQKDLRNLGAWKKKDTYAMFYGEIVRSNDALPCHHVCYTGTPIAPLSRAPA